MKRNLFVLLVCLLGMPLMAQQDPVLMRVNGKEILRSEFENAYNAYHSRKEIQQKTPKEYAELFVNFKLKVAAAESTGMDTAIVFREEQAKYRRQLSINYLTDNNVLNTDARQLYEKMKAGSRAGQVQVMQVYKRLPQVISPRLLNVEEVRMDSIYRALINQPDLDFVTCVTRYSEDKNCAWIGWLQTTQEFENVVFSLQKGEVSKPFFTPQGLHIVKVLDRKEMLPFDQMQKDIISRLLHRYDRDKGTEAVIDRLKKEYQFVLNEAGVEELLTKGMTGKALFTLDGKEYTGVSFRPFADAYPQSLRQQLNGFIQKTVLDYENSLLEKKYPGFRYSILKHREDFLVTAITDQKILRPATMDNAGLVAYFKVHKSHYNWKQPRYNGIVLHCVTKKIAKQAKKLLKKLPEKEWLDIINKTFNISGIENVKMEQGLFAEGDNMYVDKLIFKRGDVESIMSYPFTAVAGRKQKGPDNYKEVLTPLTVDFQNYLDVCWTEQLRATGKVEINQEVLKTVNNH